MCQACKAVNFSRRTECYKCGAEKSRKAVIIPVVKQKSVPVEGMSLYQPADSSSRDESKSLMLRGSIIRSLTKDDEIREVLSKYGLIQEIRRIRDKDFAFVEFVSHDDA